MPAVRTLVVWCPDWPVVAASHPDVPLAVMAANRVVACSAAARAEGVQRGLRRRQAEARCPQLVVVPHDPGRDARAFEPVMAAVETFTPRVELVRPGVCALATLGPARYFGGDEALAARVAERVDQVLGAAGARCGVGVADGRFAAERAARRAGSGVPATVIIPPGGSAGFLASFPVGTLEAAPEMIELLGRLGIRTLGEFARLPPRVVLARFGPQGEVAHRLALGLDERPLAARTPPPDLTVTAELDPPAERVETVAFVARSLTARLHEAVAARGLAVTLLRVEVETEHGESRSRCWRVDGGVGGGPVTPAVLVERVRWQLEGWLTAVSRPSGPLTLLRLVPEEIRPDRGRQEGFWGGDRAAAERAARAFERVQGKLGPHAVVTAALVGGRGPAEQVQLVPWGDPRPPPTTRAAGTPAGGHPRREPDPPWPGRLPLPAPATVPSPPLPAEVVDAAGAPVTASGRGVPSADPARLSLAGARWTEIVAWAGPWPVDERWWDAQAHRRRARWQVITADGAAHLLCLERGRWWLEASYD